MFDCSGCLDRFDKGSTQSVCANMLEDDRLLGLTFCEECWLDAEDDCEEDKTSGCLMFHGNLEDLNPKEWLDHFCRKFCINSKNCECYSCMCPETREAFGMSVGCECEECEEVCEKCGAEEYVHECYACDVKLCIDCDPDEMRTDIDGHTYCSNCNP